MGDEFRFAALALGMAQERLEAATKYAKQRKPVPVRQSASFRRVQFKLADMATQRGSGGLLVYQAAWLADKKDVRFTRESSMAKLLPARLP